MDQQLRVTLWVNIWLLILLPSISYTKFPRSEMSHPAYRGVMVGAYQGCFFLGTSECAINPLYYTVTYDDASVKLSLPGSNMGWHS